MPTTPKVSIGLPVFNGERYLAEAIEAHLKQTFIDFELVICDNTSTDRTPDIVASYAASDPRIRYVRHRVNMGSARNYESAFQLTSGEYFRWAAADDLLSPDLIVRCLAVLESDPSTVLAYGQTRLIDQNGAIIRDYDEGLNLRSPNPARRLEQLLGQLGLCNVLYGLMRRNALERTRRLQSFVGSDLCFLAELALYGQFAEVKGPLFMRRFHDRASSQLDGIALQQFYNPQVTRTTSLQFKRWRHLAANLAAIGRAPLTFAERLRCTRVLFRHAINMREKYLEELLAAVRFGSWSA